MRFKKKKMWQKASFKNIEKITDLTWKFIIEPVDEFHYIPGQFVQVKINDITRSYSIASYSSSENIFELLIVKLDGGAMTKILFEEINIGDIFEIKGPIGRFTLPEKIDSDILFICTGTGLAPFRSMLHHIDQNNIPHEKIYLIFGTRKEGDIICYEEMINLKDKINGFKYIPVLSRQKWDGESGYVHDQYLKIINEDDLNNPLFYLCGWRNMVKEARMNLKGLEYESKRIKLEIYD